MAQVPRYQSQVSPSSQRTPTLQVSVDPEAFGSGVAQELGAAGQTAGQISKALEANAIDMQQRVDVSTADDMVVSFNRDKNAILFDNDDAYYKLQGKPAAEQRGTYEQQIVELRNKYSGEAGNDYTRQLFDQQTRHDLVLTTNNMSSHAASELRSWEKASSGSYFDDQVRQGGLARDEDEFQSVVGNIIDQGFARQNKLDMDPYTLENYIRGKVSEAYASRITSKAMHDPIEADAYFKEHMDEMDATTRDKLSAQLHGLVAPEVADGIAERVANGSSIGNVDSMLSHVIDKYEGTKEVKDSNGYQVRMGINKKFHPEVDLSTLTKEQAIAIYKKNYWAPIANENIPPEMALSALDSAIVAGVSRTKQWLQQANGDASKFNGLRAGWFAKLAHDDPGKYSRFSKSWAARLADSVTTGAIVQPEKRQQVLAGVPDGIKAIQAMGLDPATQKAAISAYKSKMGDAATVANAAYNEATDGITGYVRDNSPKSRAEALKDPQFFTWYNQLTNKDKDAVDGLIESHNKIALTPEMLDQRKAWIGMSQRDPLNFNKIKFTDYWGKIPSGMVKEMQNLQVKIDKKQNIVHPAVARMFTYPPVSRAIRDAGLTDKNYKWKNKAKADQFYGDAVQVIDQWMEANPGKKPSPDEYLRILAPIFSSQRQYLFGQIPIGDAHMEYKPLDRVNDIGGVPPAEWEQAKAVAMQAGYKGPQLTNELIYQVWQQGQD